MTDRYQIDLTHQAMMYGNLPDRKNEEAPLAEGARLLVFKPFSTVAIVVYAS